MVKAQNGLPVNLPELARAFKAKSLPVNPIPFINGLGEGVSASGPDFMKTDEGKAILWILNMMAHGQLATIDQHEEWKRLNEAII